MSMPDNQNEGLYFTPFSNIIYSSKISLFRTLVEDPKKKDDYPTYLGQDKNGFYIYESKDKESKFLVTQSNDGEGMDIIKMKSTNYSMEPNFGGFKSSKNIVENTVENKNEVVLPGVGVSFTGIKGECEFTHINSDGSMYKKSLSGSINDIKGELKPDKAEVGYDLVSAEGKLIYYPVPTITVNKDNVEDVRYSQQGFGVGMGANIGMGLNWTPSKGFGGDLVPISVGVGPKLDISLPGNINDIGVLTEKDKLQIQNIGIKDLLSNSQSPEAAAAYKEIISHDIDKRGLINDKVTLSDEQRKVLEDKLLQNEEKSKDFESVNEHKDDLNLEDKNSSSLDDDPLKKMIEGNKTDANSITPKDSNKNDSQNSLGSTPTPLTQTGNNGNTLSNNLDHKSDHITLSYDEIFHDIQENINQLNNNLAKS